ncbi:hypothetical protein GCM10009623_28540 [Nocardioides aestuarii]
MSEHETYRYDTDSFETDSFETGRIQETGSWRHPLNVGHLVMGIAFAGMVLVWALVAGGAVADDDIQWLLPIPWVGAGAAGLVAMALAARRRT